MAEQAARFEEIDWRRWQPDETATLIFLVTHGRVLLIRKKRGLGAGKITAPGGRLEPGETPADCARRELHEEVGLQADGELHELGQLSFAFTSGYHLHVHVFTTASAQGQACETDEAIPLYFDCDQIPYGEMWADDALWVPKILARQPFRGQFLFDDEHMLGHRVWDLDTAAS